MELVELSGRQVAASGFLNFQTRARLSTHPFCIASGRSHSLEFEAAVRVLAEHLADNTLAGSLADSSAGSSTAGRTDFARSEVCPCLQSATSQGCFEAAGSNMRSCSGFGNYLEVGSSARPEESFDLKAALTDTHFGSAGHLEAVLEAVLEAALEAALVAESEALAVQSVVDIQSDIVAGRAALLVLVVPAVLAALADRIVAVLDCTDYFDSTEADLVDRTEPVVVELELAELVADCIGPDTGCIVAGSDCTEADFDYIVVDLVGYIEAEVHTFGLMADSTNFEGSEYSAECSSFELLG